jgi:hypothetical protein
MSKLMESARPGAFALGVEVTNLPGRDATRALADELNPRALECIA